MRTAVFLGFIILSSAVIEVAKVIAGNSVVKNFNNHSLLFISVVLLIMMIMDIIEFFVNLDK